MSCSLLMTYGPVLYINLTIHLLLKTVPLALNNVPPYSPSLTQYLLNAFNRCEQPISWASEIIIILFTYYKAEIPSILYTSLRFSQMEHRGHLVRTSRGTAIDIQCHGGNIRIYGGHARWNDSNKLLCKGTQLLP
jgi:hypothetical protein